MPLVCLLLAAAALAPLAGCGAGKAAYTSKAVAAAAPMAPEPPPPLERSVFSKNPDGTLSEDELQTIIDARVELDLPARVGVLPIMTARDWRGPNPDYQVPRGQTELTKRLRASEHFTLVTEIMPIPSGALGMEALREMAARYRLRYVLLYRETWARQERANAWAWGYATVLGAFFLPGETLRVHGMLEASLFDVKTGLFMFTVRRSVSATRKSNVWHQDDKLARMEAELAARFAPDLARDIFTATDEVAEAIVVEDERRAKKAGGGGAAPVVPAAAQNAAPAQPL